MYFHDIFYLLSHSNVPWAPQNWLFPKLFIILLLINNSLGPVNCDHVWCHTIECGQATSDHTTPKQNEFPYISSQQLAETPQLWVEVSRPPTSACWNRDWLHLVHSLYRRKLLLWVVVPIHHTLFRNLNFTAPLYILYFLCHLYTLPLCSEKLGWARLIPVIHLWLSICGHLFLALWPALSIFIS